MSVSRRLLLFILLFTRSAFAGGGDDFANNLFSDLGPLLALFGERVTMQFMSGAMGWADNIILAMAPLGIITAIVGAIRVGGPSWLKAVIGRARENLAAAEAELMSSTSQEVCELWNGREIVRCMGSPSVVEFICLLPNDGHAGEETPRLEKFSPPRASENKDKYLKPIHLNIMEDIHRWLVPPTGTAERGCEESSAQESSDKIIIKRNLASEAPNISLNTHRKTSRWELRIVAAFGTLLQLGVLIYAGCATYYPTLRFSKDDNPIADYAYPCTAFGTLVLVFGMMLCAHVVESSTVEERFQPKPGTNMRVRMVWLQKTKTVSDQVFGSFAIYAKDDQAFIMTSRRSRRDEVEQSQSTTDEGERSTSDDSYDIPTSQPNLSMTAGKVNSMTIQLKTVIGTITTLTGFILQFVGLRGLHWSVSIAQLGSVLLMICLKAWVRRGLATPPEAISLPPKYELDWFAKTLGKVDQAPWNNDSNPGIGLVRKFHKLLENIHKKFDARSGTQNDANSAPGSSDEYFGVQTQWRIANRGDAHLGPRQRSKNQVEARREEQSQDDADATFSTVSDKSMPVNNAVSDAQKVLNIRKDLGHLAEWSGPASAEAVSLARAIEIAMNTLIGSNSLFSSSLRSATVPLSFSSPSSSDPLDNYFSEKEELYSVGPASIDNASVDSASIDNASIDNASVDNASVDNASVGPASIDNASIDNASPSLNFIGPNSKNRSALSVGPAGNSYTSLNSLGLYWSLDVSYGGSHNNTVNFHLRHAGGKWKAYANEYEAALSLWLSSVDGDKTRTAKRSQKSDPSEYMIDKEDDARLRMEESHGRQGLWLLGSHTAALRRDLQWWVPKDLLRIFVVKESDEDGDMDEDESYPGYGSMDVENHMIIGYGQRAWPSQQEPNDRAKQPRHSTRFVREELTERVADYYEGEIVTGRGRSLENAVDNDGKAAIIAADSNSSLPLLFARHIFAAFMYAVANARLEREELFRSVANVRPNATGGTWKFFDLQNADLSTMVREIAGTGLGNLEDIYLSVIPPLSEKERLPRAGDAIIDLARKQAKRHERFQQWEEATKTYIWLFRTATTFKTDDIVVKAIAVLMEYLRQVSSTIDLREEKDWADIGALQKAKEKIEKELGKSANHQTLADLMALYAQQDREWKCAMICKETKRSLNKSGRDTAQFNFTYMHENARNNYDGKNGYRSKNPKLLNAKDILHWTPLHYAAKNGARCMLKFLLENGANANAHDLIEWTPLHYACQSIQEREKEDPDQWSTVDKLIHSGANINAQGRDGMTPLHCATIMGKEKAVSDLIEAGADVDILDVLGCTPLLWAAYKGWTNIVQNLWEVANRRLRDINGRTALHFAALSGRDSVVEWLIAKTEVDKEATDHDKLRPLHWAAKNGHEGIVALLINEGAQKEAKDHSGNTPLHQAAHHGHEKAVLVLIQLGANKEVKDSHGYTPLHQAVQQGHDEVVRLLIDHGAEKEAQDPKGNTPLRQAANYGHEKVALVLIQQGVNKEARDRYGDTPLHRAIRRGHGQVVKVLVVCGAEKEAKTRNGTGPLHLAVLKGNVELARDLVELGLNIEAREALHVDHNIFDEPEGETEDFTPLHCAAHSGLGSMAGMLVDAGAKVDARNNKMHSPLMLAIEGGHVEATKQLIDKGANVLQKAWGGLTLLHVATMNGDVDLVRLLVDKGADKQAEDKQGRIALQTAWYMRQKTAEERGPEVFRQGWLTRTAEDFDDIISVLEQ